MSNYSKTPEPGGRIRTSITRKLNSKLFFRLLGLFFSLNIMVIIITAASLAFYCESKVISALEMLPDNELPASGDWVSLSGMNVRSLSEYPRGHTLRWPLTDYISFEPDMAVRGFRASSYGFRDTIKSITYFVTVGYNDSIYEIDLYIGSFLLYFIYAFIALLAIELLTLLSRTADDRKMVRKTLDPIAELSRAAQSINEVNRQLDLEKTMALAGKLDRIDAGRLDTRIQVDDLQEELKNVAVAINGMLDRINESYAAQARFVSDASHELRTPIAVIQGYANLLDRWGMEDEKALTESVAAIKDEAGNMKDLVEQLLFLARGDSNRIRLIEERIILSKLIEEVAEETRMLDSGHEFKVSSDDAAIMADRSLIKQALRILVDNAIKYTDNGGEIAISAFRDGDNARLSVSDSGIGISPDVLPYVFDRFVRADESRARATGGAGLGLSIAQWIIMRHNGHLEVISREGIGTRMTFILPAAPIVPEAPSIPSAPAASFVSPAPAPAPVPAPAPIPAPAAQTETAIPAASAISGFTDAPAAPDVLIIPDIPYVSSAPAFPDAPIVPGFPNTPAAPAVPFIQESSIEPAPDNHESPQDSHVIYL